MLATKIEALIFLSLSDSPQILKFLLNILFFFSWQSIYLYNFNGSLFQEQHVSSNWPLLPFNPQLIKTNILLYYKGLITSIKSNHALVEPPFCSTLPKGQRPHLSLYNLDILYAKEAPLKNSLQPHWKGPYQVLLTKVCTAKLRSRPLHLHITLRQVLNPNWTIWRHEDKAHWI